MSTKIFGTIITRNNQYGPYHRLVSTGSTAAEALKNAGPAATEYGVICVKTRELTKMRRRKKDYVAAYNDEIQETLYNLTAVKNQSIKSHESQVLQPRQNLQCRQSGEGC